MLKFILMVLLMTLIADSWLAIQLSLFLASFIFGVYSLNGFTFSCLGLSLGLDYIGYILILLSFWIMALVVGSSQKVENLKDFNGIFLLVNIFLLLSLVLTFSCLDYLMFYVCFESSLIPTMILILGWGYQPERLQAGVYMLFYTLFGSLPLLISILSLYSMGGSVTFNLSSLPECGMSLMAVWYICSVMAFIVKLPVYLVHLWLPKAHVEAPVAGSMILAGVLLKLGGYGLVRVCPLFIQSAVTFSWFWVSVGLLGGIFVSFICLRQTDMKALIAYSSVAHMGLVLCGLSVFSWWGLSGAVSVMVGHGLCSSGLFCLANMVYERLGSRSLLISKGLLSFMPTMALWWFVLSAGNMAAPPTVNLLGEISLILSVVSWALLAMIPVALLSFLSAAYSLYMFSLSQHGKYFSALFSCCSGKVREYLILILHWLPLNVLVLKGSVLVC
ncbi:NADH dehydrogenase subunit 4 (mitochondrion) [Macrobrachium nipponense]|uniref:NADH-ubiquinone oxidoreductase chain 4 n=3 Tax=Macrobrachium nipponense TaxID=159736 RepID=E7EL59_MACNP|nr:NADH dehydrogenase subunit 4 [Macrobrachium nipponense]ADV30210.1 NADH dehydrogenase subunit 4 [Macrobrachium nipponense]UVU21226.1 NADH dehydrogenase subunit 4 [Macrobrachium nipponense]